MKSGTQDQVEGKFHKVIGKFKEIAGKLGMNSRLEDEGKDGAGQKGPGEVVRAAYYAPARPLAPCRR
jgi:uncharacterized protein YjbJ (UPF0337 family)